MKKHETNEIIDGLIKYLKKNKSRHSQEMSKEMDKENYKFACSNDKYVIVIEVKKK